MSHKFDVFISYSDENASWAESLAKELERQSIKVWWGKTDPSEYASPASEASATLRDSRFFVPLLGESNIDSPSTNLQLGAAMGLGKKIIPVVSRDVLLERLPVPVRMRVEKQGRLIMEEPEASAIQVRSRVITDSEW